MNLSVLLDRLLARIFLFLLFCYLYFRIFSENIIVISLAILTLSAFELLYSIFAKPKHAASVFARKCQNALLLYTEADSLRFFCQMLLKRYTDTKIDENKIVFLKDNLKCCAFVYLQKSALNDAKVLEFTKSASSFDKIYIFCHCAEKNAFILRTAFCEKNIVIFTKNKLFSMMKKYETYPDFSKFSNPERLFAKNIFSRKNIKAYLLTSVIISAFAFFSPYRIYYLVAAAVPLLLALITMIGTRNIEPEGEIL